MKEFNGLVGENCRNFPCVYASCRKENTFSEYHKYAVGEPRDLNADPAHGKNKPIFFKLLK